MKKNFLAGRDLASPGGLAALNAAARLWLETVANVRQHGETKRAPTAFLAEERPHLRPLPAHPYEAALVRTVRVSNRCRVTVDTNRYSVPPRYASTPLTLQLASDRLRLFDGQTLVADHVRSFERRRDYEQPDHVQTLLDERKQARHQRTFLRFLALAPVAAAYHAQLAERRLNVCHHVEKIVALAEIHGPDAVSRALTDAHELGAYSCEYIANLLEQRGRLLPEAGALHLTRASDLLALELPPPRPLALRPLMTTPTPSLTAQLAYLKLGHVAEHHAALAQEAATAAWSHLEFLQRLLDGECAVRQQRAVERRVRAARFPVLKTLDQFRWDWPKKINQLHVQHLCRLAFVAQKTNVIFVGSVGTGKTHLASALGYAACQQGHSVLFTTAIDAINQLVAAQAAHRLKAELNRYLAPAVLILDEIGYLPLDKAGADLLFQIISQRYERGAIIVTTNKAFKQWPSIFNNDAGITSAILDRLLHQAETVIIEGQSYRMKDQIEPPN